MAPDEDLDVQPTPDTARSPTRRRLLALLAGLPAVATAPGAVVKAEAPHGTVNPLPTVDDLFAAFEKLLTQREAALWRCDRLEAFLLAELDHHRVHLAMPAGCPIRYAADVDTIIRFVPPGRRRWHLREVLIRRQRAWTRGVRACGLTRAQAQEATLDAAVHDAAATLLATPATTLGDISTKILVLLASQEPGGAFRDASPWGELRSILADLARLSQGASHPGARTLWGGREKPSGAALTVLSSTLHFSITPVRRHPR